MDEKPLLMLPAPKNEPNKPVVIKADGSVQHSNVALTLGIANALRERVFEGLPLYPKAGETYTVETEQDGQKTLVEIKAGTLNSWITRENVIPGIGWTLRAFLEKAREEKRIEQHKEMVDKAEDKLRRTLGLETLKPAIGMFGIIKDAEGNIVMKEDARVLEIQMKTAMFVTERLSPEKYSPTLKSTNLHVHTSMAELRKAKESKEAAMQTA